jgi:hypothetical protein
MKKKNYSILLTLILSLGWHSWVLAQEKTPIFDPDKDRPYHLIVRAGLAFQTVYNFSSTMVAVERPLGHYHYVGVQINALHSNQGNNAFKYMLHGRFTGRKTGLFVGPGLKIGNRSISAIYYTFPSPFPGVVDQPVIKQRYTQMCLNWGMQRQFGRAVLEWALPICYETILNSSAPNRYEAINWTLIPSISLGYAF